jgi:tRNA (guanine37-N1)-methyltransferase
MRIDAATLFPEAFDYLRLSVVGEAARKGIVDLHVHDIRDFSLDRHHKVDDTPYGGGAGMLMAPGPVARTLDHIRTVGPRGVPLHTVLLTPRGARLDQARLHSLAARPWLAFLCARYEGMDERLLAAHYVDEELSIGDYILAGGDLPALVVVEGVVRLLPGVLGNSASPVNESFKDGLLEHPQYTRPEEFEGRRVPRILLSGHQERIDRWRRAMALKLTFQRRPDLLEGAELTPEERARVRRWRERGSR